MHTVAEASTLEIGSMGSGPSWIECMSLPVIWGFRAGCLATLTHALCCSPPRKPPPQETWLQRPISGGCGSGRWRPAQRAPLHPKLDDWAWFRAQGLLGWGFGSGSCPEPNTRRRGKERERERDSDRERERELANTLWGHMAFSTIQCLTVST